ncbi:hypothetical protein PROFUN_12680 [Planoprotostelium fungivorum]|uniref:Uncharacterized protein n=1 Tax=Planoprotostelium fungivorum TaxID=1890364 RepID=A0A2P6N6W1_9EUKA|nr:hypothetical protein PROFUN_12680 [Planoprotostelium fungivorum]
MGNIEMKRSSIKITRTAVLVNSGMVYINGCRFSWGQYDVLINSGDVYINNCTMKLTLTQSISVGLLGSVHISNLNITLAYSPINSLGTFVNNLYRIVISLCSLLEEGNMSTDHTIGTITVSTAATSLVSRSNNTNLGIQLTR